MTRLNTQFSVKGISLLNSVMASSSSVQFKNFCSIKSTILLEMKCPQLSKPEATAARNQNSIGDRTRREKNLGRNQAQSGGHFSSGQTTQQFNSNCCKVRLEAQLVPEVLSWWLSRWRGPHWGSVSGAHLGVLVSADVQGCRGRL